MQHTHYASPLLDLAQRNDNIVIMVTQANNNGTNDNGTNDSIEKLGLNQ